MAGEEKREGNKAHPFDASDGRVRWEGPPKKAGTPFARNGHNPSVFHSISTLRSDCSINLLSYLTKHRVKDRTTKKENAPAFPYSSAFSCVMRYCFSHSLDFSSFSSFPKQ